MTSASASLDAKSNLRPTTEEETPDLRPLVIHRDQRGSVREAFRSSWYPDMPPIVQVVHSESRGGVMRAMHAHAKQFDVWHFTQGKAQVQLYDHRDGFWSNLYVEADTTLVIPPGISHGFLALTPVTLTYYLTREYDGTDEFEWNAWDRAFPGAAEWKAGPDPSFFLGMVQEWYIQSDRDKNAPSLEQFAETFPA